MSTARAKDLLQPVIEIRILKSTEGTTILTTHFIRSDENRVMTTVDTYQRPHAEAEPTVRIETKSYVPRWIKFASKLQWSAERRERLVGDNNAWQSSAGWHGEVEISSRIECCVSNSCKFSLWIVVDIEDCGPSFSVDRRGRFPRLQQFYHTLNRENYDGLGNVDDHSNSGQSCD